MAKLTKLLVSRPTVGEGGTIVYTNEAGEEHGKKKKKNKHEIKLNSVQNSKIQSTIKILFLYNKS